MFPVIHWNLISLEILLTLGLSLLTIIDMFLPKKVSRDYLGIISIVAFISLFLFWLSQQGLSGTTFGGMFVMDSLAWFFKAFFLAAGLGVVVLTRQFFTQTSERKNVFYLLLWMVVLGACLIASSADFLVLFIALEILTISLYVMTAYLKSDRLSIEAGMKYLILGALSSGFFLYGMSFLYGTVHTTRFDAVQAFVATNNLTPMLALSLVMMLSSVFFKIAAVPFHMWAPDVYQGAPTPVTALLSVASKAAGFVVLIRLIFGVFAPWHHELGLVLAILAAITMTYGNLVAMFQTNIKRLLGYSSISHAGYLLMGAAAGTALGATAMNFYLVGYLATALTAFAVIILVGKACDSDTLDMYAGLYKRSGLLAAAMVLALVSLAGMPPLVGFFGKFALLMETVRSGYLWLALVAAVNIVISFYYYLMVAKRIFGEEPADKRTIEVPAEIRALLCVLIAAIVILGLFQAPAFDAATTAVKGMFLLK